MVWQRGNHTLSRLCAEWGTAAGLDCLSVRQQQLLLQTMCGVWCGDCVYWSSTKQLEALNSLVFVLQSNSCCHSDVDRILITHFTTAMIKPFLTDWMCMWEMGIWKEAFFLQVTTLGWAQQHDTRQPDILCTLDTSSTQGGTQYFRRILDWLKSTHTSQNDSEMYIDVWATYG